MVDKGGKRALIDTLGAYLTDFIYDIDTWLPTIQRNKKEFCILAHKNGKAGILNAKGEDVVDFIYENTYPLKH